MSSLILHGAQLIRQDWQGSTWFENYSFSGHPWQICGTFDNEKLTLSEFQVSSG